MSLVEAVARKDAEKAAKKTNTPAKVSTAALVQEAIQKQTDAFRLALPKTVDPDRFARLCLTAVKGSPELMQCFATRQGETSVLVAAMQAAALGLEPNTLTQDCWLIPKRNHGVWEACLWLGYRGKQKLMRRAANVATIFAEVVYEKDHFVWERGFMADVLEHDPAPDDDRGDPLAVYAIIRYCDPDTARITGYDAVRLTRAQVERHRAASDSWKNTKSRPYSPWTLWTEDMWKKTAIHALSKVADLSPEVEQALTADEKRLTFNDESGSIDIGAWDMSDELPAIEPDHDRDAVDVRESDGAPGPHSTDGAPSDSETSVAPPTETEGAVDAPPTTEATPSEHPAPSDPPMSAAQKTKLRTELLSAAALRKDAERTQYVNRWLTEHGEPEVSSWERLSADLAEVLVAELGATPEVRDITGGDE